MAPHDALRVVEAKLHEFDTYIGKDNEVWKAMDTLWDLVVLGKKES